MADILTASDDEIARLVAAFRGITSMQQRMRVVDVAERAATKSPVIGMASPARQETSALDALRQKQSLFQGNQ